MNALLFLKRVVHGSFGNLKPNEQVILDALIGSLPPDEGRILTEQLSEIEIIQRSFGGRMVLPFYSQSRPPKKLSVPDGEFCVAKLKFTDGTRAASVRVQSYNGHFRSLEFSKALQGFHRIRVTAIDLHPKSKRSLAETTNRLEHGTDET